MFKRFANSLRSYAAPAVLAVAGLFAMTAEQAQAATFDMDAGTFKVEVGDNLTKIARNLSKEGVEVSPEEIFALNTDILSDANQIQPDQVLKFRAADVVVAAAPSAEDVDAMIAKVAAQFSKIPAPELSFADFAPASFNPFDMWGVKSDIVLAQATTEPAPEVSAADVAEADVAEDEVMLGSSIQIWSDEGLAEMTKDEVIADRLSLRFDTVTDEMVLGYMAAVKAALASNMDVNNDGEAEDYDGILKNMNPDSIKALPAFAELSGQKLEDAVRGFQMGAMDAQENDIPCDELTQDYYTNAQKQAMPNLPDATIKLLAEAAFAGYDHGRTQVLECEDCAAPVETTVRPQPRPETPTETYTATPGASLCSDVARGLDKSFEDVVRENNLKAPYLLELGQVLDLSNVDDLDEENDKLFEQYCTGTGPLPPVRVTTPHVPGVTPTVPSLIPTHPQCKVENWGGEYRLTGNFESCCLGKSYKVKDSAGNVLYRLLGGETDGVCRDEDSKPYTPPVVEPPTGGCKNSDDCGGGGDDPNGDLDPVKPEHPVTPETPKEHPKTETPKENPETETPKAEEKHTRLDTPQFNYA